MNIKYASKSWTLMQLLTDLGPQARDHLTNFREDEAMHSAITRMMQMGYVRRNNDGLVEMTFDGQRNFGIAKREFEKSTEPAGVRSIGAGTTKGTYEGRELGRTSLRPGAYDAYEKPSLMGSQRVQPRVIT